MRTNNQFLRPTLALIAFAASFIMRPETAFAHEPWFVEEGKHAGEYFSLDVTNLLVVFGALSFVLLALTVHRSSWLRHLEVVFAKSHRLLPKGIEWRVVAVLSGIMLIANALAGTFLAPVLVLPSPELVLLGGIGQVAIGLILLSQLSFFLAGLLILVVALPLAIINFSAGFLVDYGLEYVALALAFMLVGLSAGCPDKVARVVGNWIKREPENFAHLPVPLIRIGLGLTFIALSLHYKLTDPNIALTFLDKHDLNFISHLGLTGFTNLHFVFAAGVAEVTVGSLLAFGIATRLVSAAVLGLLLITLALFGPIELIGHLPILGIVLLLLYRGSGSYVPAPAREGIRAGAPAT